MLARSKEKLLLSLLLFYTLFLSFSFVLSNTGVQTLNVFVCSLLTWLLFVVVHFVMCFLKSSADEGILALSCAVVLTGLFTIMRLAPKLVERHVFSIGVGVLCLIAVLCLYKKISFNELYKYVPVGIFALLIATLLFGVKHGGAISWIVILDFGFQPSEIVKILLVVSSAYALMKMNIEYKHMDVIHSKDLAKSKHAWITALVWISTFALLVFQKDLGTTMVFFLTCLIMATVGTSNYKVTSVGIIVGFVFAAIAVMHYPHIRARFSAWPNPWLHATGSGYQILQSFFALSAGGLMGKGFSLNAAKLIPASFTDMNFAAIGEEMGLLGVIALVLLLFAIVYKGLRAAIDTKKISYAFIAVGAAAFLGVQGWIIMAGNLGLLPLTGVTLPLVSFGGTSMVTSMVMIGMVLVVSSSCGRDEIEIMEKPVEKDIRKDSMNRTIKQVIKVFAFAFSLLIAGSIYIQVIAQDKLAKDVLNPRVTLMDDTRQGAQ